MFGYINVNGAQLSEENKKIYQSYYCGLCRKLKEFCGKKGQALLNYDMTFLVVLLTGLYEPDTQTGEFTCMMHPMKKRQLRENDIQSYAAQGFIDAVKQRQNTLMTTMQAIIDLQRPFFLEGDESLLKPMILKDVAERTGLDISTISRVSNSKYVQTNFGIYPLKFFFSDGYTTEDGEEMSVREIRKILKECIDGEDKKKPLTDDELADILKEKGYPIARRTVAKYRQQLNIPVARLRK